MKPPGTRTIPDNPRQPTIRITGWNQTLFGMWVLGGFYASAYVLFEIVFVGTSNAMAWAGLLGLPLFLHWLIMVQIGRRRARKAPRPMVGEKEDDEGPAITTTPYGKGPGLP